MKKDNSTLSKKVALRLNALKEISDPVIMETHGGNGRVYARCYKDVKNGIVFEKDSEKVARLAEQRPSWAVYQNDCVEAIRNGVGSWMKINYIDIDPYGECWPIMDAVFSGAMNLQNEICVVVNDGLRNKLKTGGGWSTETMKGVTEKYGNAALYKNYVEVCRELVIEKAAQRRYKLCRWTGYYCGNAGDMTHYAAILRRDG